MSFRSTTAAHGIRALALVAAAATTAIGQQPAVSQQSTADPLNLAFERPGIITATLPARWGTGGQGYVVTLDSVDPQSGARSLRIRATTTRPQRAFGVATTMIPGQTIAGKTIRLRGYIRTEGIAQGYAGLWMRVDGPNGMLAFDNMSSRGVV